MLKKYWIFQKISFQKIVLIFAIWVFIVGIITDEISFDFKKENSSHIQIQYNLENIQNITWKLLTSPDNAWLSFYESISNIESSLKVQTYEFTKKELRSKFKKLLDNWVDIKLIMENYKYKQFKNTRKEVAKYFSGYDNFEIKSDDQMRTKYVHSKINLVDSGFWIQTANLTHSSFAKNREHFFYSENTGVRKSLDTIFEKDWHWEKIELEDIHPNLVVCNINCRDVIEILLSEAKKSIIIQTQYIVDDRVLDILKNKVWQGVWKKNWEQEIEMKFVVSDTETSDNLLMYFGPSVARKFTEYYNHTKMILIDNEILLLWSMNLSDNSLDNNREIWIILLDDNLISEFKNLFEKDWEKSKYKIEN